MRMYCRNCGATIANNAAVCPACGVPTNNQPAQQPVVVNVTNSNMNQNVNSNGVNANSKSRYSKMAALILCFFLGFLGVHRFYVRKGGTGFLWLITVGLFGIGWIVDFIMILLGVFTDKEGYRLRF